MFWEVQGDENTEVTRNTTNIHFSFGSLTYFFKYNLSK